MKVGPGEQVRGKAAGAGVTGRAPGGRSRRCRWKKTANCPRAVAPDHDSGPRTLPALLLRHQLFGFGLKSSFAVKMATIKGGMNHSPVDIKFNKLDWTITGGMNHSPTDLKIDHEAGKITGGANLSPVDLKFAWSPEEVTVEGGANRSPVNYTVNWKKGLLEGYANHAPLKLEFSMGEGLADVTIVSVKGYAGRAPVELTYNKVNGHIGGGMGHSPVDINLVNCDLYDFLQYVFLFIGGN